MSPETRHAIFGVVWLLMSGRALRREQWPAFYATLIMSQVWFATA